jgi:hypothetical protein
MTSYIQLLKKIEDFCDAHYQIQRYGGEFREQMPNLSTESEKYPIVFVTPTSGVPMYDTNQISLDIYCVDVIQKDRENLNTIVSDCHLILTDLYGYFSQGDDLSVDVIGQPSQTPLNNLDLDYVAGWMMTIVFEIDGYCVDAIPMSPITPGGSECPDADVENSDATYSTTVESGGSLTLPDSDVYINDSLEGSVVSVKDVNVDIVDSSGSVTPDSVTIVGNTVTIDVPDSSISSVGAKPIKTGQTTSYASGDDGATQRGRLVDFFTLSTNNAFGNTNRFTDLAGGQTYSSGSVFLDHSTDDGSQILAFTNSPTNNPWSLTLSQIASQTTDSKTDWAMPNRSEMELLINEDVDRNLNWSPLNVVASPVSSDTYWWTSTTPLNNTARAKAFFNSNGVTGNQMTTYAKTLGSRSLACRYYTYAELGL